tara:strand:- start:255 stop:1154 length:900 start_codon:yes stop_codon:yes gene_type:complete
MIHRKDWWRFHIEINRNIEDLLIWKLNQYKISTFAFNYGNKDENISLLIIWLPTFIWKKACREILEKNIKDLLGKNGFNASFYGWELIKEEDWLNSWKKFWDLELIGKNFLVLPCWMNLPSKYENKIIIRIDPGAAFGTGGHPSTSLCLEMMEKTIIKDKRILDVGCGSGILSIAAKKLGAKNLHLVDNDYLAINASRDNVELNFDKFDSFSFYQNSFSEIKKQKSLDNYELIFCNIIASVIKPFIPHFYELLSAKGSLILSGILDSQKEEIIKLLNLNHFRIDNVSSKKDWICIKSLK